LGEQRTNDEYLVIISATYFSSSFIFLPKALVLEEMAESPAWTARLEASSGNYLAKSGEPRRYGPNFDKIMLNILQSRFRKTKKRCDEQYIGNFYSSGGKYSNGSINAYLFKVSNERLRSKKANTLLIGSDLEKLELCLDQYRCITKNRVVGKENFSDDVNFKFISYTNFRDLGFSLPGECEGLFSPSNFFKFRRDKFGMIDATLLFTYLENNFELLKEICALSTFDSKGDGYLREADAENFFLHFLEGVPSLASLQEEFHMFYVFTAVRKVFFFLDTNGCLKVSIKDILTSPLYREIFEIQNFDLKATSVRCRTNWFSGVSAMNVYSTYLSLDIDQNGKCCRPSIFMFAS
jgi:hypothetical protein